MDYAAQAEAHLGAARAAAVALDEEYGKPRGAADPSRVSGLHQQIGYAFKSADVYAALAVADRVGALHELLEVALSDFYFLLHRSQSPRSSDVEVAGG